MIFDQNLWPVLLLALVPFIIALVAAISFKRTAGDLRREVEIKERKIVELQSEVKAIEENILDKKRTIDTLETSLKALKIGNGEATVNDLSKFLDNLDKLVSDQIRVLENTVDVLPEFMLNIDGVMDESRTVDRRNRFRKYREIITSTDSNIKRINDLLRSDLDQIRLFIKIIQSERLNVALGIDELEKVESVLSLLKTERANRLLQELKERRSQAERDLYLKFKEKMEEVDRRIKKS